MPQSYNYIKTRNRRELVQQNNASDRVLGHAGTNIDQPGATGINSPLRVETGVLMPGQYMAPEIGVEALNPIGYADPGTGNVLSPPTEPRPVLSSLEPLYPFHFSGKWRSKNMDVDPISEFGGYYQTSYSGTNDCNPYSTSNSGSMHCENTQGSVGRDPDKVSREKRRREKRLRR